MTKEWEREFAVSRMREDPTISYRALAKVLDLSDQTVRRWRDEEGIQPRPHHNTGRRRNGTRSAPWLGKPARPIVVPIPIQDDDDDGYEDGEDEEGFEPDDAPSESHAASLAQTWETIGKLPPLFRFNGKPSGTPRPSRTAVNPSPTSEDPKVRLRAIVDELRARKPRGPAAVKLLVEAVPYLTGGVNALAQNGEAWGCARADIVAAERIVVGKGRR